jgi:hypothetical protein
LVACLCLGAAPARAFKPALCPSAPLKPWSKVTEKGVTVRCGPSKIKRIPGDCAMLTVSPRGAKPWTTWALEDRPGTVRTFKKGELLVVGTNELRFVTRATRDKDSRVGALPPTAKLYSELDGEERQRVPSWKCDGMVRSVSLDGEDHLLVRIHQASSETGQAFAPVELRIAIADGSMRRITPLPQPPPLPELPPPPPEPVAAASAEPPEPDLRPADRPTADRNFGKPGVKVFKKSSDSWWSCSATPGGWALALAVWAGALRRRRAQTVRWAARRQINPSTM